MSGCTLWHKQGIAVIVWAFADRFLDIVGLIAILFVAVKATLWVARRGKPTR